MHGVKFTRPPSSFDGWLKMAQGAETDFHVNGLANGPSELWKRKLKTLFTCLDADGNGFLNRDDLPVLASKFRKYGDMSEETMNSFAEKLSAWWDANFDKDASLSFDVSLLNFTANTLLVLFFLEAVSRFFIRNLDQTILKVS